MITLRPYQEESLERIWDYFASGNTGNPLIAYPTGTGKSAIPAVFIKRIMQYYPSQRFLMITHVKELIEQNTEVLKFAWPDAPVGIYSAGLKSKHTAHPIIFGGIQSMIKNPSIFGFRDIIFIDEAHLISQDESSQYLTFLATMKLINPSLKIIGLTATPFRMGQGLLTDSGLFTDIIHDLTKMDEFNKLIADGYLCPLIPMRTKTELDVSNVGMAKGEFIASQLQGAVDKNEITYAGLKELVEAGRNRKSWLIFSSGIEHAEHISSMLRTFGVECAAVHSKQTSEYNDKAIKAFKSNQLRSISCFSKLTTGFNHPDIDLIGDFRPTMSIPLHIQKLGRGTRPAPNKDNCLVLDFGRNVPRLGPVNDPIIPKKKGASTGDLPVKICDSCGAYNHISAQKCCACGAEFTFQVKIVAKPGTTEILRSDAPIVEMFNVDKVIYVSKENKKTHKPPYIRATYFCGMQAFSENIFPEHGGYATKLFRNWWKQRHVTEPPTTVKEALNYINQSRIPKRIKVWCNKQYPEILSCEY
jgi:DNA repair protein RadD